MLPTIATRCGAKPQQSPPPYVTLEIFLSGLAFHIGVPPATCDAQDFFIGFSFSDHGLRYQLLEPVMTTEFTILELAYSRTGSLPRVCAPTGLRSTGATTYKTFGPYSTQKTRLIRGVLSPYMLCSPTIAIRCGTKPQQSPP